MSASDATAPAVGLDWLPAESPHGAGLVAAHGGNRRELVPYLAADGSARLGGYAPVDLSRRSGFPRFPAPPHDLDPAARAAGPLVLGGSGP